MTEAISWYLDGRPIRFGDWQADATAHGGFRDFSGKTTGDAGRRAQQESELAGYRPDGSVLWYGKLTLDPELTDDGAAIRAEGIYKQDFSTKAERLFFMHRTETLFKNMENKPWSYPAPGSDIEIKVESGALRFWIPKGASIGIGDAAGFVCWIENAVLSNFNATMAGNGATGAQRQWIVSTAAGPSGGRFTEGSFNSAGTGIDLDLIGGGDLITVEVQSTSGAAIAQTVRGRLVEIELRGLATSSDFTVEDVLGVILKLGNNTPAIAASAVNAMPLDWKGTTYDLAQYITGLADWWWQIYDQEGTTVNAAAGPWESVVRVARSDAARTSLAPQRRYNRVRVPYTTTNDDVREAVATAVPDPFPGREVEFLAEALKDKQRDGDLAEQVAEILVARYSQNRRTGGVQIARGIDDNGRILHGYDITPGILLELTDHDPVLPPQRAEVVKYGPRPVAEVDLGTEVSAGKVLRDAVART